MDVSVHAPAGTSQLKGSEMKALVIVCATCAVIACATLIVSHASVEPTVERPRVGTTRGDVPARRRGAEKITTFQFLMPVVHAPDAPGTTPWIAMRLADVLGHPANSVQEINGNPSCAFWVEEDWFGRLGPPAEGYLIRISLGGAQFLYTSVDQGEKGIDHLARVITRDGDKVLVPEGILTNFPVID